MKARFRSWIPLLVVLAVTAPSSHCADGDDKKLWTDPEVAAAEDADFSLQGEYVTSADHETARAGMQAAALGDGQFLVALFNGGLPGAGWDGEAPIYSTMDRAGLEGSIGDGERWTRQHRESPTLGQAPPEGAVVLFSGEPNDLVKGEVSDGVLWAGAQTTGEYGSFQLHVEFRLPYKPNTPPSSQDRGNSGLYLHNRYECQVLDSFGLVYDHDWIGEVIELKSDPKQWCGCFYKFKAADVPMCLPPLTWQTYDIDFTAAGFDDQGNKTTNARATVRLNGVVIHDDVELPKGTGAGGGRAEVPKGPIIFQGHGNPTAYRNVWLVEK